MSSRARVSARCLNVDKPRRAANSRLIRLRPRADGLDVAGTRLSGRARLRSYRAPVLWSRGYIHRLRPYTIALHVAMSVTCVRER